MDKCHIAHVVKFADRQSAGRETAAYPGPTGGAGGEASMTNAPTCGIIKTKRHRSGAREVGKFGNNRYQTYH